MAKTCSDHRNSLLQSSQSSVRGPHVLPFGSSSKLLSKPSSTQVASSSRTRIISRPPPITLAPSKQLSSAYNSRSPSSAAYTNFIPKKSPSKITVEPLDSPAFLKGDLNFSTFRERAARAIAEWGPSPTMNQFSEFEVPRSHCSGVCDRTKCFRAKERSFIASTTDDCRCCDIYPFASDEVSTPTSSTTPTRTLFKTHNLHHPSIQIKGSTSDPILHSPTLTCCSSLPVSPRIRSSSADPDGFQLRNGSHLLQPYIHQAQLPSLSPPQSPFTPLTPGPHSSPRHRQENVLQRPPSLKLTSTRRRRPSPLRLARSQSRSAVENESHQLGLSRNVRFADGSPMRGSTWHLTQYPARLASPPISAANLSLADLVELEAIKQSLGTWCGEMMGSPLRSSFSQSSIASTLSELTSVSDEDYYDDGQYLDLNGNVTEEYEEDLERISRPRSFKENHLSKQMNMLKLTDLNIPSSSTNLKSPFVLKNKQTQMNQTRSSQSENDVSGGSGSRPEEESFEGRKSNWTDGIRSEGEGEGNGMEFSESPSSFLNERYLCKLDYDSWLESSESDDSDCDSEIFEGVH